MKNKTCKVLISLIIILILFSIQASSAIPDAPEHKQVICFDCHTNGRFNYGLDKDEYCGGCHQYVDDVSNKLIVPEFEANHNTKTCKVCHGVKDTKEFHTLHGNVSGSCTRCHGDNGNAKPDKTINECGGCHGGQIHVIHQDNLTGICSTCHGSRPVSNPASGSVSSKKDITAGIYAKVVNYKQFTLYEVFKRILSSLSI